VQTPARRGHLQLSSPAAEEKSVANDTVADNTTPEVKSGSGGSQNKGSESDGSQNKGSQNKGSQSKSSQSDGDADGDADAAAAPRMNKDFVVRKGRAFVRRVLDFSQRKYHGALGLAAAVVPEGPVGGLCGITAQLPFTSEQILLGYAQGMFPMDKRGSIQWTCPNPRCVVPLDKFHVPSRIRTYLRKGLFELCFDRNPAGVLSACGDRKETWLTPRVQAAYQELFDLGAMHTVEAWKGDRLVGGAFGVALATVFTVESMFSLEDHASKLAFAFLGQHLIDRGFTLIDCQYQQVHFARFGAIEMPRDEYRKRIALGMIHPPSFQASKAS
jgi:leucyl/phenylalanyl-tRNA---protein transferase